MKRKIRTLLILLLFIMGYGSVNAVNAEDQNISKSKAGEQKTAIQGQLTVSELTNDTKYVLTSPARWNDSDWNNLLMYGGTTYLISRNDEHSRNWFQEKRSRGSNEIAKIGNAFPGVGLVYMGGTYFLGNEKQQQVATIGLESAFGTFVATESLKAIFSRNRPSGSGERDSFPSGHTALAFSFATVISHEYKDDKYAGQVAYGLATITGLSRLNDNRHWASDVVAGGLIGHYVAKTMIKLNADPKSDLKVQPYVDSDKAGILVKKKM